MRLPERLADKHAKMRMEKLNFLDRRARVITSGLTISLNDSRHRMLDCLHEGIEPLSLAALMTSVGFGTNQSIALLSALSHITRAGDHL